MPSQQGNIQQSAEAPSSTSQTGSPHIPPPPANNVVPSQQQDLKFPSDSKIVPVLSNITYALPLQFPIASEDVTIAENTQELIVPSYSLWFSLDHIHEIEVKAFPDFFPINYVIHGTSTSVASQNSGETTAPEGTNEIVTSENRASGNLKTPDSYKELSNFIVNFYRANPKQYLTVTACRRHRVGDVSSIIRVHTFLEQWGIINFQVDMVSRPISLQTVDSRHFKILAKTPSKFVEVGPAKSFDSVKAQEVGGMADVAMHVEPIESIPAPNIYDSDKEMEYEGEPEVIIYCKSCGVQCRRIYYHCAKIPSYNLCPCCFCEGRFLMSFYSADFVQLDLKQHGNIRSNKGSSPAWTDQELLYLLEGLEMYGSEDWDAVAKHVGSTRRSREDCIAKFLELPIEENFSSNFKNKSSLSGESLQLNPLFSAENPVMAVLSFLASMVHPNVASAAAQAAIVAYSEKEAQSYQSEDSSNGIYNKEQLESVTNLVLEDAAEKAKQLVGKQDEKINHTLNLLFEVFYKKMELKMQQVTALEDALRQEQVDLEKQKTQILEQKLQIMKTTQELASLQAKKATSTDVSTTASINPSVMHPGKEITLDIVDDTTMNA